jgi:ABC-2 type transport system permease protein
VRTATAPASPPRPPGSRAEGTLAGTRTLIRLVLRRDRVRLPVWLGSITLFTVASAVTFPETYPTAADRAAAATSMELPASVAMLGPNYAGPENYTYGPMIAHQMLVMTAVIVGVMSVLLLVRHARAEEEAGRAELVRASIVGRHAPMAAALTVVGAANVVLALLIAASLGASGMETVTWEGSLLYGASLAAVGLVFAGVAAVTVQVSEHARGASGMAMAALGVAYAVRAAGDVGEGRLTWLSPIGWAQQTRAYVDDRWWPLLPALALAVLLVVVASRLSSHRDVGAGLRPQRPGPRAASAALSSPLGHALRLQRASLVGWGVAVLLLGAMYGSFLGGVEDLIGDLEAMEDMLPDIAGADLTAAFVSMITTVVAMVCSIQAVLAVLRLRSEESAGRAEPLLATGLSRERWAAGHLLVALGGGALVLLVAGLGLGLAGAVATADGGLVWRALGAALAHVPAVWVTVGVAMALFGLVPRAALTAWAVVVYSFLVVYLGGFLQFPAWMSNLSPFGHVPQLPAEDLRLTPLVVLTVIAAALVAAGLVGLRRRDLRSPA